MKCACRGESVCGVEGCLVEMRVFCGGKMRPAKANILPYNETDTYKTTQETLCVSHTILCQFFAECIHVIIKLVANLIVLIGSCVY